MQAESVIALFSEQVEMDFCSINCHNIYMMVVNQDGSIYPLHNLDYIVSIIEAERLL